VPRRQLRPRSQWFTPRPDSVAPLVVVHFTNGKDAIEVTRALIERLPS
jgi:hypothetical protein